MLTQEMKGVRIKDGAGLAGCGVCLGAEGAWHRLEDGELEELKRGRRKEEEHQREFGVMVQLTRTTID